MHFIIKDEVSRTNSKAKKRERYKLHNYLASGAPIDFSDELFLPWIHKIMLAYQDHEDQENNVIHPAITKFSKAYYLKKMN